MVASDPRASSLSEAARLVRPVGAVRCPVSAPPRGERYAAPAGQAAAPVAFAVRESDAPPQFGAGRRGHAVAVDVVFALRYRSTFRAASDRDPRSPTPSRRTRRRHTASINPACQRTRNC